MNGRIRTTLVALVLGGCSQAGTLPALRVALDTGPARTVAAEAARDDAPDDITGTAGILAKNSSKFLGQVMAPPGILGKNSSKYRTMAFSQLPYARGLVVLTTPDGMYLTDGGKAITATTDEAGRYDFGAARIPAGQDIFVTATFPGNRLLLQYAHAVPGDNYADVDAAGTYVTAYLLARSHVAGRELRTYDRARLPALRRMTAALLADGTLVFDPDKFMLGRESALVDAYAAALGAAPDLARAWDALLGR